MGYYVRWVFPIAVRLTRNADQTTASEFPFLLNIHWQSNDESGTHFFELHLRQKLRESEESELKTKAVFCLEGMLMNGMSKIENYRRSVKAASTRKTKRGPRK